MSKVARPTERPTGQTLIAPERFHLGREALISELNREVVSGRSRLVEAIWGTKDHTELLNLNVADQVLIERILKSMEDVEEAFAEASAGGRISLSRAGVGFLQLASDPILNGMAGDEDHRPELDERRALFDSEDEDDDGARLTSEDSNTNVYPDNLDRALQDAAEKYHDEEKGLQGHPTIQAPRIQEGRSLPSGEYHVAYPDHQRLQVRQKTGDMEKQFAFLEDWIKTSRIMLRGEHYHFIQQALNNRELVNRIAEAFDTTVMAVKKGVSLKTQDGRSVFDVIFLARLNHQTRELAQRLLSLHQNHQQRIRLIHRPNNQAAFDILSHKDSQLPEEGIRHKD